ncbi:MAG: hypothetical protein ABW022_08645 [Actinoplanes sp.]
MKWKDLVVAINYHDGAVHMEVRCRACNLPVHCALAGTELTGHEFRDAAKAHLDAVSHEKPPRDTPLDTLTGELHRND